MAPKDGSKQGKARPEGFFDLRTACRICGSGNLQEIADFGTTPIADLLQSAPDCERPGYRAPLRLVFCADCRLSQLSVDAQPQFLFTKDYPYFSSVSPQLSAHFEAAAKALISCYQIDSESKVLEIASNDGVMLRWSKAAGAQVLGIDPAYGPAEVARQLGIETIDGFFDETTAHCLVKSGYKANLIIGNNVLAHVPDPAAFARGVAVVLADDGRAVFEFPYFADLVEKRAFDTIYHQHYSYFLLKPLLHLWNAAGLEVLDAERVAIHGGTLRLTVGAQGKQTKRLTDLLAEEESTGWITFNFAQRIRQDAQQAKTDTAALFQRFKADGLRVAAWGAAGKACTCLSWLNLDASELSMVADLNPRKHGSYMPGTDLRIVSGQDLADFAPDVVIILAWNFADEIRHQIETRYHIKARFFTLMPTPQELT